MSEANRREPLAVTINVEWVEHMFTHPFGHLLALPIRKELITLESLGYQILARYIPEEKGDNRYVGYEVYSYRDENHRGESEPNGLVQSVLLFKNGHGRYVKDVKRRKRKPCAKKPTENSEHVISQQEHQANGPVGSHGQAPSGQDQSSRELPGSRTLEIGTDHLPQPVPEGTLG